MEEEEECAAGVARQLGGEDLGDQRVVRLGVRLHTPGLLQEEEVAPIRLLIPSLTILLV